MKTLDKLLNNVKRQWRLRRAMQGFAIWCVLAALLALLAIVFMDANRFSEGSVASTRSLFAGLLLVGLVGFVLLPTLQAWPRLKLARYAESKRPELDGELITAVDAAEGRTISTSPELADALISRTATKYSINHRLVLGDIERPGIKRAVWVSLSTLVLSVLLLSAGPVSLKHGAKVLATSDVEIAALNPYTLDVDPGNSTILEGEDFRISATTRGFDPDKIQVLTRPVGENSLADDGWQTRDMRSADESSDSQRDDSSGEDASFENFVFNVDNSFDYQIIADGVKSEVFTVNVTPKPQVEQIDLVYQFPKRTGRDTETVTDAGDIRAVRGTRVEVQIKPDRDVEKGQLVVDGNRIVPLTKTPNGEFKATLDLNESGQYRVELQAGDSMTTASREHTITALDDGLPVVQLLAPGRDAKVTSIEEVEFRVDASDDVAVGDLELVVSVNGGAEEVIRLGGDNSTLVRGEHMMLLEELELAPGDLVSYYARASDAPGLASRLVATDMYFLDVRPFEQSFREGSGAGGGGGGGGGGQRQAEENLSAQQRTLVVALFKVSRDKPDLEDEVVSEKLETLSEAQGRIRERVEAIVRRLKTRRIVDETPGVKQMTDELPKASKAMLEVNANLSIEDIDKALASARQALLHLQRADAAFREVQVSQQRRGNGGQGNATSDMANLFRLEMDRFRNQYSDLQRGQAERREERDLDDTMRKLREMSRRQTREVERAANQSGSESGQGNGSGTPSQQRLAEEVEALLRELKKLTRKKQDNRQLADSVKKLEDAAKAMRDSAKSGDRKAGERALEKLEEAKQALAGGEPREGGESQGQRSGEQSAEQLRQVMRGMQATRDRMPGASQGYGQSRGYGDGENQRVPSNAPRQDGDLRDLREGLQRQADALGPVADGSRADNPDEARDIEAVMERLAELNTSNDTDELAVRYGKLLRELQNVEQRLRGEEDDAGPTIIANTRARVDHKDRDAVDRYYRALSESRDKNKSE